MIGAFAEIWLFLDMVSIIYDVIERFTHLTSSRETGI